MNNDIKHIEDRMKGIIEKNEDSVKGFEKAAENAKEGGIKNYFEQRAEKRRLFIKTLHNATPALKTGNREIEGSIKGTMHRTWMDAKTFFSADSDEVMLQESVRGDRSAIDEYNEILADSMVPHRMREIIKEQRDEIQNDLETLQILEEIV
ncbi:PA2169 family four-helix-bundle protein [Maribacter chungangensis]|uniref:PA2169 family four-helix-bundle protein n=1 Tax=Maribacter chungangensis TaxID=1069117 RepID=A0ABW3B9L6_9FLAO